MKRYIYAVLIIVLFSTVGVINTSCKEVDDNRIKTFEKPKRITLIEKTILPNNSGAFYIIKVDGKEYLATNDGGIIEITKD